jgi:hypothetical protein
METRKRNVDNKKREDAAVRAAAGHGTGCQLQMGQLMGQPTLFLCKNNRRKKEKTARHRRHKGRALGTESLLKKVQIKHSIIFSV